MRNFKFFNEKSTQTYTTFEDLTFFNNGINAISTISFQNGYGASVVTGPHTYGGSDGLYELGVLDSNYRLTYETPITNDVIGFLTSHEVTEILKKIQDL